MEVSTARRESKPLAVTAVVAVAVAPASSAAVDAAPKVPSSLVCPP